MFNQTLPSFSLKPLPLVLSLHSLMKSLSPASCTFLSTGRLQWDLLKAFSSPYRTIPVISFSSQHRYSSQSKKETNSIWVKMTHLFLFYKHTRVKKAKTLVLQTAVAGTVSESTPSSMDFNSCLIKLINQHGTAEAKLQL